MGNLYPRLADHGLSLPRAENKGLSLSGIVSAITGVNPQGFWGRLVDLMFLIATVGALTISLVVTAATFTRGLSALTGLPDNFTVQAFVILLSGGIFCMSSWIGINNGLQRLSKMVGWGRFCCRWWYYWLARPNSSPITSLTPSA